MDAALISRAVAAFVKPYPTAGGKTTSFTMLPVQMKVLEAEAGSCSKAATASRPASMTLKVFTAKLRCTTSKSNSRGFLGSLSVLEVAVESFRIEAL